MFNIIKMIRSYFCPTCTRKSVLYFDLDNPNFLLLSYSTFHSAFEKIEAIKFQGSLLGISIFFLRYAKGRIPTNYASVLNLLLWVLRAGRAHGLPCFVFTLLYSRVWIAMPSSWSGNLYPFVFQQNSYGCKVNYLQDFIFCFSTELRCIIQKSLIRCP